MANDIVGGYMQLFSDLLTKIRPEEIDLAANALRHTRDNGGLVYIAGNGGSASTATHLANDLAKATKSSGMPPIKALSLSDNVSWLTALGNDEGYERIFAGQMENFLGPDDMLIVISASGNSGNLVQAVEMAKAQGVTTLGITGFTGGKLRELVDLSIWLPSPSGAYGPVETAHSLVVDLIKECLMADRPTVRSTS
ncbi:D-sedoheptulose-7-phosphate isomerase [Oceanibium sediminis]|uniref:D-sedoheptulose-7-phosphate isomerase n=1 Tax=Oceanibium sediminis TaxID=2026339 RepID=UPI0013003D93|nr:SIS domain-containing protein [Oceanibium sediminis]